jgi:hypothetical protein
MGTFRFAFWGERAVNLLAILVNRKQLKSILADMRYDKLEWSEDTNMTSGKAFGRHKVSVMLNGSTIATIRATENTASWLYPMMN